MSDWLRTFNILHDDLNLKFIRVSRVDWLTLTWFKILITNSETFYTFY